MPILQTVAVIASLAFYIVATFRLSTYTYRRYSYESILGSGSSKSVGFARYILSAVDMSVQNELDLNDARTAAASVLLGFLSLIHI